MAAALETTSYCYKREDLNGVLFSLDFTKAYDMLDWKFILNVLRATGFGKKWFNWVEAV